MDRRNQPGSKIAIIAIAILVFSILCFGAVEGWSSASLEASVFILALVWVISRKKERLPHLGKEEKYMLIVILFFITYTLIQMLPFPSAALKYVTRVFQALFIL